MISFEDFVQQLTDAYERLYDLVYLRTHPIAGLLVKDAELSRRDQAWRFHHFLLDVIQELEPGAQAPMLSREWRRHRLMVLRYVDGLPPQSVADQLAISRRHYYRGQKDAIEALAHILWDRYIVDQLPQEPESTSGAVVSRLELLRLEAARVAQTERFSSIQEIVDGVLGLLGEKIRSQHLTIEATLPSSALNVAVDRQLLRQLLMAIVGYLIDVSSKPAVLRITGEGQDHLLHLTCVMVPDTVISDVGVERLIALEELANLLNIPLKPLKSECERIYGFSVHIPIMPQHTVLVIDDNQDILALFQRYLSYYRVVTASNAQSALTLAQQLRPFAITLDLMMPDQDGWDLLQMFLHHPDVQGTPIIICSVLRQKELALSLGATAFLEKPVSEETLLSVLGALHA